MKNAVSCMLRCMCLNVNVIFICWQAHFVVHLQLSFVKLQSMQALGLSIPSVLMHHAYRSHWLQGSACDLGKECDKECLTSAS